MDLAQGILIMRLLALIFSLPFLVPVPAQAQCDVVAVLPPTTEDYDRVGSILAVEGVWAFIGLHGSTNDKQGRVVVYRRGASGWALHQELFAPIPGRHPMFGNGIAVANGLLVVNERQSWVWKGQAWFPTGGMTHLFELDSAGDRWRHAGRLRPPDLGLGAYFGGSLDTDGSTVVVGHFLDSFGKDGRIEVFERAAGGWTHQRILPPDGELWFGQYCKVSGTHLTSTSHRDLGWSGRQVQTFERGTSGWKLRQRLDIPPGALGQFEPGLDGDLLAVSYHDVHNTPHNIVQFFSWNQGWWHPDGSVVGVKKWTFTSPPTVAISGNRVALGDAVDFNYPLCNGNIYCQVGSVYLLDRRRDGSWKGKRLKHPNPAYGDSFGSRVALDGDTLLAGAPNAGSQSGIAYILRIPRTKRTCASTPNSTGAPARMDLEGCASVLENDVALVATPVPDTWGLFVYGEFGAQIPWGPGFTCVGAPVRRLPLQVATGGVLRHPLELGGSPFFPGSSWHFQAWFREVPGASSAFQLSDGMRVVFEL